MKLRVGKRQITLPQSKWTRAAVGSALVFGGLLSFLPILGVWMLPLGLLVLSADFAGIRRLRRKSEVWFLRNWRATKEGSSAT